MTEPALEKNCIDIVVPFGDAMNHQGQPEIHIMGGIGSAALTHPSTLILPDERFIVTGPDFLEDPAVQRALQPIRPEDGTRRDLDILVMSTDGEEITSVERLAKAIVEEQLDVSAFGLHDAAELEDQRENPGGWHAVTTFVSDRFKYPDGSMKKGLFPFEVPIDPEVLETWHLEIGDRVFPVANPASTILNYLTRSISGLRAKDAAKVQTMARNIFRAAPELVDWTLEGPGQSQMELAGTLHTLRRSSSFPRSKRTLDIGGAIEIKAGSVRALADHEVFMLPDADADTRDAVLGWSVVKSRALGIGESQEDIVRLFRNHFEGRVDGITKNSSEGRISLSA